MEDMDFDTESIAHDEWMQWEYEQQDHQDHVDIYKMWQGHQICLQALHASQ